MLTTEKERSRAFWSAQSIAGAIKLCLPPRTTIPFAPESKDSELRQSSASGGRRMLWTIFVILLLLWLVGLVSSYTLGGFIHLLLLAAVIVLILRLLSGRRPVI